MRHTHSRVGGIDRLAARAAAAVHVHAHLAHIEFNVHIFHFGQHRHCDCAGVDTPLTLGFGHALNTVDAAFPFQAAESAAPAHLKLDFFEAVDSCFVLVDDFD